MPTWNPRDNKFYCSWNWKCDFSHEELDVVSKHEDEEHNASWIESARAMQNSGGSVDK